MKQARIYMKRWLGINERSKQLSTDTWYLNFANQLLSLIDESPLYSKKFEAEKVDAALSLFICKTPSPSPVVGKSFPMPITDCTSPIFLSIR